jgi:hypothetical protein
MPTDVQSVVLGVEHIAVPDLACRHDGLQVNLASIVCVC